MHAELVQTRARILRNDGGPDARQPAGGSGGAAGAAGFLRSQAGAELSAEQRAGMLVPLAWFHVPKTGTTIVNTFYHTPAICPAFLWDNYYEGDETFTGTNNWLWNESWGDRREEVCPGGFSDSFFVNAQLQWLVQEGLVRDEWEGYQLRHGGIGGPTGLFYQLNRGHLVTMMRQPEQRLISSYYYFGPVGLHIGNASSTTWPYNSASPSLREYAEQSAGCTVRQLTMDVYDPCETFPLPTIKEDVSVAIEMLHEGFAFVGITEHWDLSVCLFRAMFGGTCVSTDFTANTRPTFNSSSSYYDTSELYGWVDALDGRVYGEALSIFESTRGVYGVDDVSCNSFCKDTAR